MTIAIDDISISEELDRAALTAVRGGNLVLACPPPGEDWLPEFPAFPCGFPFTGGFPDMTPVDDGGPKAYPL